MKFKKILVVIMLIMFLFIGCNQIYDNKYNKTTIEKNSNKTFNETKIIIDNLTNNTNNISKINTTKNILSNQSNINTNLNITINNNSWYKPKPSISWQWQLQGEVNTSYDVDLYDIDLENAKKDIINELHQNDIKVICYFSAGSYENYRYDSKNFPKAVIGNVLDGWPDENWLDISNYEKFSDIMKKRLDMALEKGCDGIEPDNIDGYLNDNGFDLTYDDQLKYNIWLAKESHKRNLSIALKNDFEQIKDLIDYYDFAINEQCFEYNECDSYLLFIKKNKAVLGVEYEIDINDFCNKANKMNFSWLKMEYDLDGSRISCE